MVKRPVFIIFMTACLFIASMCCITNHAKADITYWSTAAPVSHNSTRDIYYGHYHADLGDIPEAQVINDGNKVDLYGPVAYTNVITTHDYTNLSEWVDPGESSYREPVGFMPPGDATVTAVFVYVVFTQYRPSMNLAFSINNGSSYTESSTFAESRELFMGALTWNVTSYTDWTPELLNSTDLLAKGYFYPVAYTHYYLDYLGFVVYWEGDYAGGGDLGGDPDEEEYDTGPSYSFDQIMSEEGVIAISGLVGLIGMVMTPTIGIYIYRHGNEETGSLFIKMLVLFMFCLTFFMVSISGA